MVFLADLEKQIIKLDQWTFNKFGRWYWYLMVKLGHTCPHYPVFANRKSWLWETKYLPQKRIDTCSVCHHKVETKIKIDSIFKNYAQIGRQADVESLLKSYKTATNEAERTAIKKSLSQINNEDKKVRDMRESLIKATRDQEHNKIKEVHDYVSTHKKYRHV